METINTDSPEKLAEKEAEKAAKKKRKKEEKEELTRLRLLNAYERTLLSWVRTATSLLTLGFALYKLLQARIAEPGEHPIAKVLTPKMIAVLMFGTGVIGLVMAMMRHLKAQTTYNKAARNKGLAPVMLVAYVILALLLLLLVGVSFSK